MESRQQNAMESCILKVLLSADLLPGVIARVETLRSAGGVCRLWRDLAAAHVKAERRPKVLLLECGCSGVVHVFDVVQRTWSVQRTPFSSTLHVPDHGSAALVAGILHVEVTLSDICKRAEPSACRMPAIGLIARYDPLDNAWLPLLPVHPNGQEYAMAAVGSRLSLVGGSSTRTTWAMSVLDASKVPWRWRAVEGASYGQAALNLDRIRASASAFDGQLWLVGGFCPRLRVDRDLASVLRWRPSTAAWAEVAPLPTARQGVATCWCRGQLYALGGGIGDRGKALPSRALPTVTRYCPRTDRWEELGDMPRVRWSLAAVARLGKVYVFGGTATPLDKAIVRKVDVYDPALEAWSTLPAECDLPLGTSARGARGELGADRLVRAW